jgi:heme exporter protein D
MLGIEDKYVWLAYLLCIASALLCVIYSLVMRNRGEERVEQEDVKWAAEEKKAEEEL